MSEKRWDRVKSIFHEASELPADERASFLDRVCADDGRLRSEVEALLESHEELEGDQSEAMTEGVGTPTEGAGDVIGRYKLLQTIGEGGFGTVYMAEQEVPVRRRVALKIIKLGMDTKEVIARFEAERQALALMEHPNIAKVLDAGATESGRPFFVMELVRGIPITTYCDQNKLGTTERLELFMAVCGAVQHAHQKGIIHRDIKPTNVMVTLHDGTPVPKIIDFGIAKATNQRLTEKTLFTKYDQFIGTPAYMSPEQAEMSGLDVDTRSDIYSLGVLLYELLTGTTPLDARRIRKVAFTELQRLIREEEPHRPSVRISTLGQAATAAAEHRRTDLPGLAKALRGDLDWVVMKALEKDRTRRYETANALRMELQRFLANEPVLASPPSAGYRLRKFVRRNRTGVTVGATVATALVIGLLLAAVGLLQARREAAASKAINDFFSGMLASVDPLQLHQYSGFAREGSAAMEATGELAEDISVVEMMLRARDRIASSFTGKPTLEATARETIGLSLLGLGRPREAAEELEKAAGVRRAVLGNDHPDTLRSELQLGLSLTDCGRAPEAVPFLDELRHKMTRLYGEDDPRTLRASSLYATALMMDRRQVESDPIFQDTLERQRRVLGEKHRDTLDTATQWANSRMWRGQGAAAEELTRPAFTTALRLYGPDDVLTLMAQTMLGWSRNFQGDRQEGEALLRPAVDGLRRALGDNHPYTCRAKSGLARSLLNSGRDEERERLWTEALEGLRASEGTASPAIYVTSRDLAYTLLESGKTEQAVRLFRRAAEDFRTKYGESHQWTVDNVGYLADALWRVGEINEATAVSKELLEVRRKAVEDPGASAEALNAYAWDLLTWYPPGLRDPAAALPIAERAVDLLEEGDRAYALDTLALALHLNHRTAEAIEVQRQALALASENEDQEIDDYVARLAKYLAVEGGAEDEIRSLVLERVRGLESVSHSADTFVLNIGGFSNWLANEGLHQQSEFATRQALEIVQDRWDGEPAAMANLDYRVGRALLHQGRATEAEAVLREGVTLAREANDNEALSPNQVNLAEALAHLGRYREVRAIAAEVLDRNEDGANQQVPRSYFERGMKTEAKRLLGIAALALGDVSTAEPLLLEAARRCERTLDPDSWRRARARSAWGECLVALGRFDEAEPILLESQNILDVKLGPNSTATRDASNRLVRLYRAWGKPTQAARWAGVDR